MDMKSYLGAPRKSGFLRAHKNHGAPGWATIGDGDCILYDHDRLETIALLCLTSHQAGGLNKCERAQAKDWHRMGKPVLALAFDDPGWPRQMGPYPNDPQWPTPIYIFDDTTFNMGVEERKGKHTLVVHTMTEYFDWEESIRREHSAIAA